jgi:hypothetical protein
MSGRYMPEEEYVKAALSNERRGGQSGVGTQSGELLSFERILSASAMDPGTASSRFFFHVMASLAEMERELIVERTRAG